VMMLLIVRRARRLEGVPMGAVEHLMSFVLPHFLTANRF
jgi:hypothetical protein